MAPVDHLTRVAGQWYGRGGPPLEPQPASRDSLPALYGTYIPGTADDAALIDGVHSDSVGLVTAESELKVIEGTDGIYEIDNSTPASVFENTLFLCTVSIKAALSSDRTFWNCKMPGNNPTYLRNRHTSGQGIPPGMGSALRNWSGRHITLIDTDMDARWWYNNGLSEYEAWLHSASISGGHFTAERSILAGFTDGVNFTGAPGNASGNQYVKIIASRLGPNYYAYDIPAAFNPQALGYTHSDAFQWNTGPNVEIAYSYLGGPRLLSAKPLWPGGTQMRDSGNSTLMFQQEDDDRFTLERRLVTNTYVHHNWLAGGTSTININFSQGNALPGPANRIEDNRVMRKIAGFNDISYYIRYREEMETSVRGNVVWDPQGSIYGTGTLVTANRVRNTGTGGDQQLGTFVVPA